MLLVTLSAHVSCQVSSLWLISVIINRFVWTRRTLVSVGSVVRSEGKEGGCMYVCMARYVHPTADVLMLEVEQ